MNTEKIVVLVSLTGLIISSLAIIIGFISLYQLRKNYPDYPINSYKNIGLWLIWILIFVFSYGLLKYQNWGRFGLIIILLIAFAGIFIGTIFRIIGYIMLVSNKSEVTDEFTAIEVNKSIINQENYQDYHLDKNYNLDDINQEDEENYYLDELEEEQHNEEDNNDTEENFWDNSLKVYAKQGLIVTIIMAFISNLIIFSLISYLKSIEVQNLML